MTVTMKYNMKALLRWMLNNFKKRNPLNTGADLNKAEQMQVRVVSFRTSWPVITVWIVLSLGVTLSSIGSFVQPEWFVREDRQQTGTQVWSVLSYSRPDLIYTLGLFGVCYRDSATGGGRLSCFQFGADNDIVSFPSSSWQVACILFGAGCVIAVATVLLSVASLGIKDWRTRRTAVHLIGYVQASGVLIQACSLLLFPVVLSSNFAKFHCGPRASIYNSDSCKMGWAYMLAIVSVTLGCYCPLLARFSFTRLFKESYQAQV